jgi:hypothetical protein
MRRPSLRCGFDLPVRRPQPVDDGLDRFAGGDHVDLVRRTDARRTDRRSRIFGRLLLRSRAVSALRMNAVQRGQSVRQQESRLPGLLHASTTSSTTSSSMRSVPICAVTVIV